MPALRFEVAANRRRRMQRKELKVIDVESSENSFQLRSRGDGRLVLKRAGEVDCAVSIRRCFPWSEPLAWLSLRAEIGGEEVALVEDANRLPISCREALLSALHEAAFVFEILEIVSVTEEFELRQWRVKLKSGERVFQTKLLSWPRELSGGGLLLQDVAGDLYSVMDPEKLDPRSKEKLWAFTDD